MADNSVHQPIADKSTNLCETFEKICSIPATANYVDGCENPVAWIKRYSVRGDQSKDTLFNNLDMKSVIQEQYGMQHDILPEFIKWRL